jgi:uridine kinase
MLTVGIAGGTGSGKTTVVKKVYEAFPDDEVIIIPQDSYYRDNSNIQPEERQKLILIFLISIIEKHLLKSKS